MPNQFRKQLHRQFRFLKCSCRAVLHQGTSALNTGIKEQETSWNQSDKNQHFYSMWTLEMPMHWPKHYFWNNSDLSADSNIQGRRILLWCNAFPNQWHLNAAPAHMDFETPHCMVTQYCALWRAVMGEVLHGFFLSISVHEILHINAIHMSPQFWRQLSANYIQPSHWVPKFVVDHAALSWEWKASWDLIS